MPVYLQVGNLTLGEGESIRGDRYVFDGSLGGPSGNFHRTLASTTAYFNSNRWCFGGGNQVTYQFGLPGHAITSGTASFNVNHYVGGECTLEVSRDGEKWHPIATQKAVGSAEAPLPAEVLPAETLLVRLRASGEGASFQVDRLGLDAKLTGELPDAAGRTLFADMDPDAPRSALEGMTLEENRASGANLAACDGEEPDRGGRRRVARSVRRRGDVPARQGPIGPGQVGRVRGRAAGRQTGRERRGAEAPDVGPAADRDDRQLHRARVLPRRLRRADRRCRRPTRPCGGARRRGRSRRGAPLPEKAAPAATLAAARNDREAVQIVVRPDARRSRG